jgi:hypothetical protein
MRFAGQMGRTHDPFAMQKVVGSSPIIRLYTLQNDIFGCLSGQQMAFARAKGDEFSPLADSNRRPLLTIRVPGKRMHLEALGCK